jgi:small conductance mechanosensitive channel
VLAALDPALIDVCGERPSWFCEAAWNLTENRAFARAADWFVTRPLLALVIVVIAALVNRWLRKAVTGLTTRITTRDELASAALERIGITPPETLREHRERAAARASTLSSVLRAVVSAVVWSIAILMVLGVFQINLGPLLAGAGIAGIAVGLGAQSLVRDCISGFFILLEDQFGVGDTVDVGPAIGTVEALTLRATTVRSVDGTQWSVPNGSILRVGNKSRAWVRAAIDVTIATEADVDRARSVLHEAAERVCADDAHARSVIAAPVVQTVERVTVEGTVLRVSLRVKPGTQADVLAALRTAARNDLTAADIPVTVLTDV